MGDCTKKDGSGVRIAYEPGGNDIVREVETLRVSLPSIQEHALRRVLLTSSLSEPQVILLSTHVDITRSLETLAIESERHPSLKPKLTEATETYMNSFGQVGSDPVVAEALRQYDILVSVSQVENEP